MPSLSEPSLPSVALSPVSTRQEALAREREREDAGSRRGVSRLAASLPQRGVADLDVWDRCGGKVGGRPPEPLQWDAREMCV